MKVDNHSVEFRVDGYTIMDMEVCEGTALVHTPNPLGVEMLIEFDEPRQLLDACMKMHGIKFNELRWYAELMLSAGMMMWAAYRPASDFGWNYKEDQHNYDIAWA